MTSFSDDNQADVIESFNSASRYLVDLLIIDKLIRSYGQSNISTKTTV